jgi:NAD(P)-dependent dehydrogenase (short-subunit alcohol dehydrogenase family)
MSGVVLIPALYYQNSVTPSQFFPSLNREEEQAFKRWADPAEIAEPIYFLASEGASFVSGSDWLADCGWVTK